MNESHQLLVKQLVQRLTKFILMKEPTEHVQKLVLSPEQCILPRLLAQLPLLLFERQLVKKASVLGSAEIKIPILHANDLMLIAEEIARTLNDFQSKCIAGGQDKNKKQWTIQNVWKSADQFSNISPQDKTLLVEYIRALDLAQEKLTLKPVLPLTNKRFQSLQSSIVTVAPITHKLNMRDLIQQTPTTLEDVLTSPKTVPTKTNPIFFVSK